MSIPIITFFNNKGGVGKTSMVYHLSWMFADCGLRVVAADLDPQANLTAAFVDEGRLEEIMSDTDSGKTVFGAVTPLKEATGDIQVPHLEEISENLGLIIGDMALSTFEDDLSEVWPKCLSGDPRAFRITSAFWRIAQKAARCQNADLILVDLGPNLGAINRAALIASDYVVIPLGPDLFSLQGLRNLGPTLRSWRDGWGKRLGEKPPDDLQLPPGNIQPIGYVVLRHSVRIDRPVKAFEKWIARIPSTYADAVLGQKADPDLTITSDPHCIARLKDYRSLMPMAHEARKPMFFLKPADGALGAHTYVVQEAYNDFKSVASRILQKAHLDLEL